MALACRSLSHCFGAVQLCQVYDSAEFCRNVHANPEWQRQAVEAIMLTASKPFMHVVLPGILRPSLDANLLN